eukprot:gene9243-11324_t
MEGDIIGLQECMSNQIDDIQSELSKLGYLYIGTGRDDGISKGEHSPIFYNSNRLSLVHNHQFWVSDNAHSPGSKSWDTACPRIVTWGLFKLKGTAQQFYFLNTHLDHKSELARSQGTLLIRSFISYLDHSIPIVLVGDFNALPKSKPIFNLTMEIEDDKNVGKNFLDILQINMSPLFTFQNLYNCKDISNVKSGPDCKLIGALSPPHSSWFKWWWEIYVFYIHHAILTIVPFYYLYFNHRFRPHLSIENYNTDNGQPLSTDLNVPYYLKSTGGRTRFFFHSMTYGLIYHCTVLGFLGLYLNEDFDAMRCRFSGGEILGIWWREVMITGSAILGLVYLLLPEITSNYYFSRKLEKQLIAKKTNLNNTDNSKSYSKKEN